MNYKKIYDSLINKSKKELREKNNGVYYESHHIVPRSLGGDNSSDNIVLLTGREHYIAHLLLSHIHKNDKNAYYKMCHALHRFLYSKNADYKISSRDYDIIKERHAEAISYNLKGKVVSNETKEKMSNAQKEIFENRPSHFFGRRHTEETKALMSKKQSGKNNPQYGKKRPEDVKRRISEKMKGVKKSPETIEKFRNRKMSEEEKQKISEGLRRYHAKRKAEKMG